MKNDDDKRNTRRKVTQWKNSAMKNDYATEILTDDLRKDLVKKIIRKNSIALLFVLI